MDSIIIYNRESFNSQNAWLRRYQNCSDWLRTHSVQWAILTLSLFINDEFWDITSIIIHSPVQVDQLICTTQITHTLMSVCVMSALTDWDRLEMLFSHLPSYCHPHQVLKMRRIDLCGHTLHLTQILLHQCAQWLYGYLEFCCSTALSVCVHCTDFFDHNRKWDFGPITVSCRTS